MASEGKTADESKLNDIDIRRKEKFMVKWDNFYGRCIEHIENSINYYVMEKSFSKKKYSEFYTIIFNMCIGTGNNVLLNVNGVGSIPFSQVTQIQ